MSEMREASVSTDTSPVVLSGGLVQKLVNNRRSGGLVQKLVNIRRYCPSLSYLIGRNTSEERHTSLQPNQLGTCLLPFALFISAPNCYPTWIWDR